MPEDPIVPAQDLRPIPSVPGEVFIPLDNHAGALEVLRAAAEGALQASADLADVLDAVSAEVRIRNRQSGAERTVGAAAVPFFTNQGYELVDELVEPAPETPGRHEATEPADAADPGASTTTTPDTTSKEN